MKLKLGGSIDNEFAPPTVQKKAKFKPKAFISALTASALLLGGSIVGTSSAFADDYGQDGSGGYSGGGINGSGWTYWFNAYNPQNSSDGSFRTDDAYSRFKARPGWASYAISDPSQKYSVDSAFFGDGGGDPTCLNALNSAKSRAGDPDTNNYRIVLVGSFVGDSQSVGGKIPYYGSPGANVFQNAFISNWNGGLKNAFANNSARQQAVYDATVAAIPDDNGNRVCVVLHTSEYPNNYKLNVATDARDEFTLSGSSNSVHDSVTLSTTPTGQSESVNVTTVLHYDGVKGGQEAKSVSKVKAMPVNGTTDSQSFTPADFGWKVWPAGKFWYDTIIPKQGNMDAGVDAADRDSTETWDANFKLDITTDVAAKFSQAGATTPVSDMIHANSHGSGITSKVTAKVTLNWDSQPGRDPQAVTKTVDIALDGDTRSPNFVPSDFGWQAWPTGDFWFDVQVDKQSLMDGAVNTPDREVSERWHVEPPPPAKTLTSGNPEDVLFDHEVLAAGMYYNAVITANAAGYSWMEIQDTIHTDKVWIGSETKDVKDAVYVLDPDGKKVAASNLVTTVTRANGDVVVKTRINNIPAKFAGSTYKLVVPTYVLPTEADYRIPDDSRVIYSNNSKDGNSEEIRKVTPKPDKVWVLDENGALVAEDPNRTNNVAADNKVFLMGDAVSAVVNGRVPKNLAENLSVYKIMDDWSDAAKYIDFTNTSKVKVYYETAPGSGKFTDVTSQFTIAISGNKTTATAKAAFLNQTKGQTGDRAVKLVISGNFRNDYDTNGKTVKMINKGSETWNSETMPTNEPPVYTWTPDPEKQVRGSAEQDGAKTYEDIDGQLVLPGQKLEYTVGIDVRVPSGTARGVKSLAVKDVYDPLFIPDKRSVEIWDSRDATNPKPVAASNYTVQFDDKAHTFTVTFTKDWIDKNVNNQGENSQWLTKGWLTMRFTGTVNPDIEGTEVIDNIAYEIINNQPIATQQPKVTVPPWDPHKEDLNTEGVNIDGKTVVQGDIIVYRLTMDAHFTKDKLAYYVHKLGMIDDYDDEYLDVKESSIKVTEKGTGKDVTDQFNTQIKNGVVYVFAKQVDFTTYDGTVIKGEPQPKDLAAYAKAKIVNGQTPIINQNLLGKTYYVTFQGTVTKEVDGYVIENQGTQIVENSQKLTEIVTNPLKDIDPTKDVVIDEETKDKSIHTKEVELNSDFNYRLNSSEIPANRAYKASQWGLTDKFDPKHDQYTGIWAVYANTDIYEGNTLVYKKGDLLQDSAGHETEPRNALFTASFDEKTYTFKINATQKFLNLVNTRMDKPESFSVYVKMIRIAPGDKIVNTVDETYNKIKRKSNTVWTKTFEHPAIDVEKFTLSEGMKDGDRDDVRLAYELERSDTTDEATPAPSASATSGATPAPVEPTPANPTPDSNGDNPALGADEALLYKPVKVGFVIKNTGDVPLKDITFEDTVNENMSGAVDNIVCEAPTDTPTVDLVGGDNPEGKYILPSSIKTLDVNQEISCSGDLIGMLPGMTHGDTVKVTGKSIFTGKEVTDEDPWFAHLASNPGLKIEKYTLDEGLEKGDRDKYAEALELNAEQAKNGLRIAFDITNTGDEDLTNIKFTDMTHETSTGKVEDIKWYTPVTAEQKKALLDAYAEAVKAKAEADKANADKPANADDNHLIQDAEGNIVINEPKAIEPVFEKIGDKEYQVRKLEELTYLAQGETVQLIGILRGVEPGTPHGDTAKVTGEGIYSSTPAEAEDPWFAKLAGPGCPEPKCDGPCKGAVTGEMVSDTNAGMVALGIILILSSGFIYGIYRYRRSYLI